MRIGVLTSGGDAPGMNAVVAAACDAVAATGGEAIGVRFGFAGLAAQRHETIALPHARRMATEPGTWLGTSRWPQLREAHGARACIEGARALHLDALVVIGGNGTAQGARTLSLGLPTAFVPATVDLDIRGTDVAVGADSAIGYAVDVVERLRVTGRSLPGRAFVLQTLGAPGGSLADAVGLAVGADAVLVPERPLDLDAAAEFLRRRAGDGPGIVVMSEAIGDAVRIGEQLAARADVRVHPTILGHAQRAATPSALDLELGEAAGRAAGELASSGSSGFVALRADGSANARKLDPPVAPEVLDHM